MALDWEAITKASMHPHAVAVLELMAEDPAVRWSPVELTAALGFPRARLPVISYHVKALHQRRLLRRAGSRPVRGAVEHFYRLSAKSLG